MVVDRVTRLADDLVAEGAKVLVLASAAATGDALGAVRARVPGTLPVLGFDGALAVAAAAADERGVAAIVGSGCVRGLPYMQAARRARGGPIAALAWPGLVELVESGRAAGPAGAALVQAGLEALRAQQDVAVVALACAHAAAVAAHVHAAAGDLQVVDGASVVAERTRATLVRAGLVARRRRRGRRVVMTSWPDRAGGLPAGVRGGARPG